MVLMRTGGAFTDLWSALRPFSATDGSGSRRQRVSPSAGAANRRSDTLAKNSSPVCSSTTSSGVRLFGSLKNRKKEEAAPNRTASRGVRHCAGGTTLNSQASLRSIATDVDESAAEAVVGETPRKETRTRRLLTAQGAATPRADHAVPQKKNNTALKPRDDTASPTRDGNDTGPRDNNTTSPRNDDDDDDDSPSPVTSLRDGDDSPSPRDTTVLMIASSSTGTKDPPKLTTLPPISSWKKDQGKAAVRQSAALGQNRDFFLDFGGARVLRHHPPSGPTFADSGEGEVGVPHNKGVKSFLSSTTTRFERGTSSTKSRVDTSERESVNECRARRPAAESPGILKVPDTEETIFLSSELTARSTASSSSTGLSGRHHRTEQRFDLGLGSSRSGLKQQDEQHSNHPKCYDCLPVQSSPWSVSLPKVIPRDGAVIPRDGAAILPRSATARLLHPPSPPSPRNGAGPDSHRSNWLDGSIQSGSTQGGKCRVSSNGSLSSPASRGVPAAADDKKNGCPARTRQTGGGAISAAASLGGIAARTDISPRLEKQRNATNIPAEIPRDESPACNTDRSGFPSAGCHHPERYYFQCRETTFFMPSGSMYAPEGRTGKVDAHVPKLFDAPLFTSRFFSSDSEQPVATLCPTKRPDRADAGGFSRRLAESSYPDDGGGGGEDESSRSAIRAEIKARGKLSLHHFELKATVGTGTFGRVRVAKLRESNLTTPVALKILKKREVIRLKQVQNVKSEKEILAHICHPFIVNLFGTFQDSHRLFMIMEFVHGGELFSYLRRVGKLGNAEGRFYASEIALALQYLHSFDIVYRDLKPENLLIDGQGHVKLTDFGFAKVVRDRTWTVCGTPEYLAPEVIQSKGHGKSVDWWALGILIFEMLVGSPPFYDENPFGIYQKVLAGRIDFPRHIDARAKDLIKRLLLHDRTKRLGCLKAGAEDIKEHKWFRSMDWDACLRRQLRPPFVPRTKSPDDTSLFDHYPESVEGPETHLSAAEQELFKDF